VVEGWEGGSDGEDSFEGLEVDFSDADVEDQVRARSRAERVPVFINMQVEALGMTLVGLLVWFGLVWFGWRRRRRGPGARAWVGSSVAILRTPSSILPLKPGSVGWAEDGKGKGLAVVGLSGCSRGQEKRWLKGGREGGGEGAEGGLEVDFSDTDIEDQVRGWRRPLHGFCGFMMALGSCRSCMSPTSMSWAVEDQVRAGGLLCRNSSYSILRTCPSAQAWLDGKGRVWLWSGFLGAREAKRKGG
jgi:hypothetical protein